MTARHVDIAIALQDACDARSNIAALNTRQWELALMIRLAIGGGHG